MDATVDLLARVGYRRMSIEGVAAQAGVGKATVYRWWPTKPGLVVAALSHRTEIEPVTSTGDLHADVRTLVRQIIHLVDQTVLGRVFPQLAADLADDQEARALLFTWLRPSHASRLSLLTEPTGGLPPGLDAGVILDVVVGTVMIRSLRGQRAGPEFVDQLTALVVDGELPRTPA